MNTLLSYFLGPEPKCQNHVDLGFIMDSSGSMRYDYGKQKSFMKSIVTSFGISKEDTHAAVITFSDIAKHSIKLRDHTDTISFKRALEDIPWIGSTTRIDNALTLAKNEMFKVASGARMHTKNILILLTDGKQTRNSYSTDPAIIARKIRSTGVKLYVIGVGPLVDTKELIDIAGDTNNFFKANNFTYLLSNDFKQSVRKRFCKGKFFVFMINNT